MPKINHLRDLAGFVTHLDAFDVPRSPAIEKAFVLDQHIQTLHTAPPVPDTLLDLEPDEVTEVWRQVAMTADIRTMDMASGGVRAKLKDLALKELRLHVPVILNALQPKFAAAAKGVANAAATGIQPNADAQDVINLDNPAAIAAWQELGSNADALSSIARLWVDLCETLDLPPHVSHAARMVGERPDWTVCFVDPKTNLTSGYHLDGNSQRRWLALAIATNGRLRLNSPEEAQRMLGGDGESPGWIICAAGALVRDDDGRDLQLYRHNWIPRWVDQHQLDNLIDSGMVVAAKPDAIRPPDQHPIGSFENPASKRQAFTR